MSPNAPQPDHGTPSGIAEAVGHLMRPDNEQRRPAQGGEVRCNHNSSGPSVPGRIELDATAGDPFTVELTGFDGRYLPSFVDASPIGLAVVPVSDELEVVILVSARRRHPGGAS